MKKLLTLVALLGAVTLTFGQGQVTFNNTAATLMSVNSAVGGPPTGTVPAGAGTFIYALFVAPSTVTSVTGVNDANWTFTGAYANSTTATSGGRLFGGQPILPTPWASGVTANFLVRGWSANVGGQDWTAVSAHVAPILAGTAFAGASEYFGTSSIGTGIVIGGGVLPIPNVFGASPSIGGFTVGLLPVPEPSTFALAGLGAAALLIFRRRK